MPTDLRAALRDQLAAAFDAAWDATGEGFNGEYTRRSFTSEMYERMRAEHIDKILADAPPTVAELLTDDRFISGTHAIAFTCHDGAELWIRSGAWKAFTVEVNPRGRHSNATKKPNLYAYDFRQPARLVEVTP